MAFYGMYKLLESKNASINTYQIALNKERSSNTSCVATKDSVIRINVMLSTYKTLTASMIYRDEVLTELKHRVGDMVYLKNDSSKAVVSDVVIGGSNHNYYVKYKVLLKSGFEKELIPELIY